MNRTLRLASARPRTVLAAAVLLASLACSRGDREAEARVMAHDGSAARPAAPRPDPEHPEKALDLAADEVARALGSFEWTGAVEWMVERTGADASRVHAVERHLVRQLASGEFRVEARLDPGLGAGSETGKEVIYAGGMTYARALPAAFRERPTDRGRDARRFRDESFRLGAAVAALYGGALRLEPAGDVQVLGRAAHRYRLALAKAEPAAAPPAAPAGPAPDADTTRHRAFLEGRIPLTAEGELLADAESGAPLRLKLDGAFGVKGQPEVKATVSLLAQVRALGGAVAAVAAPAGALPDERKPAGPSAALEAAGLKKRGEEKKPGGEPGDEGD